MPRDSDDSYENSEISATEMNKLDAANDGFDSSQDECSMDKDDDFQLSATNANKTMSPMHPKTPGSIARSALTEEQKASLAKKRA